MLLQSIVAVLAGSLVLEAVASPLAAVEGSGLRVKREVPISHRLHERHLPHWSNKWSKRSKVPDTQVLPMRIGLKQCNLEEGHDKLMDM
jgi:tripeptidyl-peptidase-1